MSVRTNHVLLQVQDYDLDATLTSGQAFRWRGWGAGWEGIIGHRWVRLRSSAEGIHAETVSPEDSWSWLEYYLQTQVNLEAVLRSFPDDDAMRQSVAICRGLRLLRQDPWECLASFILSSTKQIVQIQQIIGLLCGRFGSAIAVPPGHATVRSFPTAAALACATEAQLRTCKMGFRAPHLLTAARRVAEGQLDLASLHSLPLREAQQRLVELPGVGPKIANCVLLFAYGFPQAFPVDVWVMKALRQLYFPKRRPTPQRVRKFVEGYFGPQSGYAQQYLFHYMRTRGRAPLMAAIRAPG